MRGLGIIMAAALGAGIASGGPMGYLPKVGPVLLRFQTPRPVAQVELPVPAVPGPLPPGPRTPDVTVTQAIEPDPVVIPSSAGEVSTMPVNLLNQALTNSPAPASDSQREGTAILSPQMFLRFFTSAASGVGREVVVPVQPGFNPAQPGQPVTSSATYTLSQP